MIVGFILHQATRALFSFRLQIISRLRLWLSKSCVDHLHSVEMSRQGLLWLFQADASCAVRGADRADRSVRRSDWQPNDFAQLVAGRLGLKIHVNHLHHIISGLS